MSRKYFGTDGVRGKVARWQGGKVARWQGGKVGAFPITADFAMKLGWCAGD